MSGKGRSQDTHMQAEDKPHENGDDEEKTVKFYVQQFLQQQNSIQQDILQALNKQNELLKDLNSTVDARLSEIQQQARQRNVASQLGQQDWNSPQMLYKGPWKLLESEKAAYKRKDPSNYSDSYGNVSDDNPNVLVGSVLASLAGSSKYESFWQTEKVRSFLPMIVMEEHPEIKLGSGIYSFTIQYNCSDHLDIQAGIIVGEIHFSNNGYVAARGVDWHKLLSNQRQTELPTRFDGKGKDDYYTNSFLINKQWKNGIQLKFTIDTYDNTIVFQKDDTPARVFQNILHFSNNRFYPETVQLFAYCGIAESNSNTITEDKYVKFTFI